MLYPVKNEAVKSYGTIKTAQWFMTNYSIVGMHTEATEGKKEQCNQEKYGTTG